MALGAVGRDLLDAGRRRRIEDGRVWRGHRRRRGVGAVVAARACFEIREIGRAPVRIGDRRRRRRRGRRVVLPRVARDAALADGGDPQRAGIDVAVGTADLREALQGFSGGRRRRRRRPAAGSTRRCSRISSPRRGCAGSSEALRIALGDAARTARRGVGDAARAGPAQEYRCAAAAAEVDAPPRTAFPPAGFLSAGSGYHSFPLPFTTGDIDAWLRWARRARRRARRGD